ncbi:MAG: hypothetical protein AB1668_06985 [Nanoarchaeota archaeon]
MVTYSTHSDNYSGNYSNNYHSSTGYCSSGSGAAYSAQKAKSYCCGRWQSGSRCGGCPNK